MIKFRTFLTTGILAIFVATTGYAAGVLYDCDITERDVRMNWVSAKLAIILDAQGKAQVIDGLILHVNEGPLPARVRKRGETLIFDWIIAGATDKSKTMIPSFSYQARLNTKTNGVTIRATPVGFPQNFSGKGTCTKRRAKS